MARNIFLVKSLGRKPAISLAFLLLLMTTFKSTAQTVDKKMDTVIILNGKAEVLLRNISFQKMPEDKLIKEFWGRLDNVTFQSADGFRYEKNVLIRFYHTNIEYPAGDDSGLSRWKQIERIALKVANATWAESGWIRKDGGYFDFVKLNYKSRGRLIHSELIFFNVQGKIAFCEFHCPSKDISRWNSYFEITKRSIHPKPIPKMGGPRFRVVSISNHQP